MDISPLRRGPNRLIVLIVLAMLLGIAVGYVCNRTVTDAARIADIANALQVLTDIFFRLIKMIIAPLVLSTLIAGIAHMGGSSNLGRLGARTILWFVTAGFIALALGLAMADLLSPGVGLNLVLPTDAGALADAAVSGVPTVKSLIVHLIPQSIFEALATNDILQIVIFSIFAGVALAAIGERGAVLVRGVDGLMHMMLRITGYVMRVTPIAVFSAMAAVITTQGLGVLQTFSKLLIGVYLSLALLLILTIGAGALILGPRIWPLLRCIRTPVLLAFSTASSEAAFPQLLAQLQQFGIPGRISGFVVPLGYSFNICGSMTYATFASIFVAQVYGIHLSLGQQISMLLLLMVTSKGIAGVPRTSLVLVAATLPRFGIPEQGMLLLLGVDQWLDMGRTATNIVGHAVATAAISKWESDQGESDRGKADQPPG